MATGKRRSGRARRGNQTLRAVLIESAHAAARTNNCQFQAFHQALTKKRGYKRAIAATAHKLSAQVLQEFYVTVTRKFRVPLAPPAATALLESYRTFPLALVDYPLVMSGIEVSLRYGISYWDGAIVAAAASLGATVLFTEDLSHGQRYGSVRVANPFSIGARGETPRYRARPAPADRRGARPTKRGEGDAGLLRCPFLGTFCDFRVPASFAAGAPGHGQYARA